MNLLESNLYLERLLIFDDWQTFDQADNVKSKDPERVLHSSLLVYLRSDESCTLNFFSD